MTIPKIIHQLWIGPKPAPINLMNTWKEKHPDFEYIFWNEEELVKRNFKFECQHKIDEIEEINGKADIMRWEILYKYGGVFLDADSICIEPFDDEIMSKPCFSGWEQEEVRTGLIATGTMGFPAGHPLVKGAIQWIKNNEVTQKAGFMAWQSVGPGLLTRMYTTGRFNDLYIFPSYYFLPIHLTGVEYKGHSKIYAYQAWGSTKQSYDEMNALKLPPQFQPPSISVSILVSSLNTKASFIQECLNSIKHQEGAFNIELVWVNDGSDTINTLLLEKYLDHFKKTTRFTRVVYHRNDQNMGIGHSLNLGVHLCSNELIIKMDSDDIMVKNRIAKQLDFMMKNPSVQVCGGQVTFFHEKVENAMTTTQHPSITWDEYKIVRSHWISNHPTLCYRKTAVLNVGNYDKTKKTMIEDLDLTLRLLKEYKYIHNLNEPLLYYRTHAKQVTMNGGKEGVQYWNQIRTKLIDDLISE